MTDAEMVALGEATIDQIVDELERRYDAVLLVYEGSKPGDEQVIRLEVATAGGLTAACGLHFRSGPMLLRTARDAPVDEGDAEE